MENKLKNIIGKKVIKSNSGGGAGSILAVDFDDGSYLFIYCSWRIEYKQKNIVASSDTIGPSKYSDSPNGVIGETVQKLEGNKVLSINLSPQYDLELSLENDYVLHAFCNLGHAQDDFDVNWEFNRPNENISIEITKYFQVKEQAYNE